MKRRSKSYMEQGSEWLAYLAFSRTSPIAATPTQPLTLSFSTTPAPSLTQDSWRGLVELSSEVVDERERRRTLLGKLSSQTPRPRWQPGERYATYAGAYHCEDRSTG